MSLELSKNKDKNTTIQGVSAENNSSIHDTASNTIIELQLGDIIKIQDPKNEKLNENIFLIDYIDKTRIKLLNVETLFFVELKINQEGTIGDGTITNIFLLSRSPEKGYARQNGLLRGTWVNISFDYDVPLILTAEITNIEEDMIELKTFPEGDILYMNFDYKGIPEDIPIKTIEIRGSPEIPKPRMGLEEEKEKEKKTETERKQEQDIPELGLLEPEIETERKQEKEIEAVQDVRSQIREMILKADQIQFGEEELGPIFQYVDVDPNKQRYSIETQTNDLQNELLSTIPTMNRTASVLNNIHTMIERFKQLREHFSVFDNYGNITPNINESNLKPLEKYFLNFRQQLLWILPVVENKQILYHEGKFTEDENSNYILEDITKNLENMEGVLYNYKSNRINDEENKYSALFNELNTFFTPFVSVNDESQYSIISEKPVNCDLNVIVDNLGNLSAYAVKNFEAVPKRFFIEKYNTGLSKLNATNFAGSQMTSERVKLTNTDIMSIKSFITLPEPIIRYSRILLPGTDLIDKANLNLNFLNYWQVLNTQTRVQDILINDLQVDYPYTESTFANNIKQFILNVPEEERKTISKEKVFEQFIQCIIPKIKILFQLMKKYMTETVSILNIVEYLEPFLVYSDNLTYMQYNEITKFIDEKISEYNKKYIEKAKEFSKLKRKPDYYSANKKDIFSLVNLLEDKNKDTLLKDDYQIQEIADVFIGNSETLRKIILKDCGKLYTTVLTFQNMKLMYPDEFTSVFDNQKSELGKAIDQFKDSKWCKNIIISKFYVTENELLLDNEKDIYFDKRYDTTNYGFIDDYEREMISMDPEKFIDFLIKKIKDKLKISQENEAEYLADTLLSGHKQVKDSQYAILYDKNMELNENEEYKYYIRKDNKWLLDPFVNEKDIQSDIPNVLCNMQPSCISVPNKMDDKCENIKLNELKLEDNYMKDILTQFDDQYNISLKDFKEKMERKMLSYENMFGMITTLENESLLKYNNTMYELGLSAVDSTNRVISPYAKLVDLILGEPDFVKKQHNIIEFTTRFTRTAIENTVSITGSKETPRWLYCNKTNTELLPTFIYQMACAYINTPDEYAMFVQKLIKEIGEKSEDGDYWVDKHSGRQIIYIGFSTEEGYEEGFRISTRDVLEKEAGEEIITFATASSSSIQPKYTTDEMKIIINIINALSVSMGLNIESQKEFILSAVLESIKSNLEGEASYKKKIKEMANKGLNIPSYTALYNATILFYTLGMFLIAVQTNMPSIKSKKTFPGCVKSFTGYPFEGEGDMSSLNYLACIAYKIKSSSDPWSALAKLKETSVASKIKNAVDSLLGLDIVKNKMNEKTVYLLTEPSHEIPDAHNILNWLQFLPPLLPFKITSLNNVSSEFKDKLLHNLKYGSPNQIEQISIIQSKNIQFSLAIQEKIQGIVEKKQLLLNKISGDPFLENACCNEKVNKSMTTLEYFENENVSISEYNSLVKMNINTLKDIRFYSEANTFSSRINTQKLFPVISNHFNEKTIYMAFIHFCHFKSMTPISEELLPLCGDKPFYINKNDTDIEIIQKLKNDKKEYTEQMMLRLLQVVSRNNIINADLSNTQLHSSIARFTDVLESCKKDKMIDDRLINLINDSLDTFNVATSITTKESRDLNNFLIKHNDTMKREIIEHITRHKGSTTVKEIKIMKDFINNLSNWSDDETNPNKISHDSLYNSTQYYKTCIKNLVSVYPNIILNEVDYGNIRIPKYWKLSVTHTMDIKNIVASQNECLTQFYDKKSLYNIFINIKSSCKNYIQLANETPSFTSIKYKEKELKPVFDERTSRFLFEYYLLKIIVQYIDLSEEETMVVKEVIQKRDVVDIFSVDYVNEEEAKTDYNVTAPLQTNVILKGNIKDLKQTVSQLLLCFIKTMNNYKNTIQFSHKKIEDTIFKLKEKEKNMITDRLEKKTDEERNVDTILKINKLGDWSKGLQKGLRTYDKDHYENEREFMETMKKYEMTSGERSNISMDEFDDFRDDYLDEIQRGEEIDRDAYDMTGMTDDYMDGNDYEGGEIDNFEDYD